MTIKIQQCDRNAAAAFTKGRCRGLSFSENQIGAISETILNGDADDDDLVQAFAKHRIEAMEEAAKIPLEWLKLNIHGTDLTGSYHHNQACRGIAAQIRNAAHKGGKDE